MGQLARSLAIVCAAMVLALSPALGEDQPEMGAGTSTQNLWYEIEVRAIGLRARLRAVEALLETSSGLLERASRSAEGLALRSELESLERTWRRTRAGLSSLRAEYDQPVGELTFDRLRELDLATHDLETGAARLLREIDFRSPGEIGAATSALPGSSRAPTGTGAISGRVSDSSTGAGVEANILVFDANNIFVTVTFAEPDGTYTTDGVLDTGSYYLLTFNPFQYIDEVYDDIRCPYYTCFDRTIGDPVAVVDGLTTTAIDFQLDKGGVIAGTVSDEAGAPLEGASVRVYDSNGSFIATGSSAPNGEFRTDSGLPTGSYFAWVWLDGYVNELHQGARCLGSCRVTDGTPISVVEPATKFIHFALELGGTISGAVTDQATSNPIVDGSVEIYRANGLFVYSDSLDASGEWEILWGIPEGFYVARTFNSQHYFDEIYDDIPCAPGCDPTSGTFIWVDAGGSTSGVDFALDPGGAISGTITDAVGGAPLADVSVGIYDSTGDLLDEVVTDSQGDYESERALATGSHYAVTYNEQSYFDELFDDIPCPNQTCDPTTGTPIATTPGTVTGGIDFALDLGGSISGTVAGGTIDTPLEGVQVTVFDSAENWFGWTLTNAAGEYRTTTALETGDYYLTTDNPWGYIDELWNDYVCFPPGSCGDPTRGDSVGVVVGTATPDIDFVLDPGGRISGTLSEAATGAPLANAWTWIYTAANYPLFSGIPDASGFYTSEVGLIAGTYFVRTGNRSGYLNEAWDNIPCPTCNVTTATPIEVTLGTTIAGIDFALEEGGIITGTVTDQSTGAPLPDIQVEVYDDSGDHITWGWSGIDGVYSTALEEGLESGSYRAVTSWTGAYANELFDDLPCAGSCDVIPGTPIPVTLGTTTSSVDFDLELGGGITGTVTDTGTDGPLEGVGIAVYDALGEWVYSDLTDASGLYSIGEPIPAGTYFVRTFDAIGYVDELYDDIPCPGYPVGCDVTLGTPVAVTSGGVTSGIDFVLDSGGLIAGTVSHGTTGAPLNEVELKIYDASGTYVTFASTDSSGTYTSFAGLPTGTYYVATDWNEHGVVAELYDDIPCPGGCDVTTGTPVSVILGATTGAIDFVLDEGGNISGVVTDAVTDAPLEAIQIEIYDDMGDLEMTLSTDAAGGYATVDALLPGTYFIRTRNGLRYLNELWNGIPCTFGCDVTTGSPVMVSPGVTTSGVDFDLVLGGSISGIVTDESTGLPLIGGQVHIYDASGTRLMTSFYDVDGTYATTTGLPGGSYFARVLSLTSHVDELYDDIPCIESCAPTTGTPIPVALAANTGGIDFALVAGGGLSGTVTDGATGAALELIEVEIFDASGIYVTTTWTDHTGLYQTEWGLLGGTHFVVARDIASASYVGELYDDLPCPLSCDVTAGAPVAVTLGLTTTGVDFQLEQGGHVAGQVTDESTGDPIDDAWVYLFDAAGNEVGYAEANASGQFTTQFAVPPGQVYLHVFNSLAYVNELWDDVQCNYLCEDPTVGTPVSVTAGATTTGIDFALTIGGTISGSLANASTGDPVTTGEIEVFDASGTYRGRGFPDVAGGYTTHPGLFTGTYHVRTMVGGSFVEELFDDILCPDPDCDPTLGDPIAVALGTPTLGIDFELDHLFFTDSFESGDTSRWSNSVP